MSEIMRPLIKSKDKDGVDQYTITEDHTVNDVLRYLVNECNVPASELAYLALSLDTGASREAA